MDGSKFLNPDEADLSYLFESSPEEKVQQKVNDKSLKFFKRLQLKFQYKKLKKLRKEINTDYQSFLERVSYEATNFLLFQRDANYLQFLIKMVGYLKKMQTEIFEMELDTLYDKYKNDKSITIDLTYFLDKYFKGIDNWRTYSIDDLFDKYQKTIYKKQLLTVSQMPVISENIVVDGVLEC